MTLRTFARIQSLDPTNHLLSLPPHPSIRYPRTQNPPFPLFHALSQTSIALQARNSRIVPETQFFIRWSIVTCSSTSENRCEKSNRFRTLHLCACIGISEGSGRSTCFCSFVSVTCLLAYSGRRLLCFVFFILQVLSDFVVWSRLRF